MSKQFESSGVDMNNYDKFVNSIMNRGIVPVLSENRIFIYKFSFTNLTRKLFAKLVEVRKDEAHTDLVFSPSQVVLATLPGKHLCGDLVDINSFKKFHNLADEEALKKFLDKYTLPPYDTVESIYNRQCSYLITEYHPDCSVKVESGLSKAFSSFCENCNLSFLADAIVEYSSCNDSMIGENEIAFNKKEVTVLDKGKLISELFKSLEVQLLHFMDCEEINTSSDYLLCSLFGINFENFYGESREFLLNYSKNNADILSNIGLFDILKSLGNNGCCKKLGIIN